MKILVIHPGDGFSTSDVYDGLVWGLGQQPGIEVYEYNLLAELELIGMLTEAFADRCEALGETPPNIDVFAYAARGIVMKAVNREITHCIAVTGSKLPWGIPYTLRTKLNIPTALLCTESPYLTTEREQNDAVVYDIVFTNDRNAVPLFTRNDPAAVHYLPHAYHPERHSPLGMAMAPADVRFIGTLFPERKALFDAVDWSGLNWDLRGVAYDSVPGPLTRDRAQRLISQIVPNTTTAALYRGAGIVINHHRTIRHPGETHHIAAAEAYSLGPRAYEIAACGAFQLSDDSRPELDEVFAGSVPTYRAGDAADLSQKIRHYHKLPTVRERLAAAAREAVAPHHWGNRAVQVLDVLASPHRGAVFPVTTSFTPTPL